MSRIGEMRSTIVRFHDATQGCALVSAQNCSPAFANPSSVSGVPPASAALALPATFDNHPKHGLITLFQTPNPPQPSRKCQASSKAIHAYGYPPQGVNPEPTDTESGGVEGRVTEFTKIPNSTFVRRIPWLSSYFPRVTPGAPGLNQDPQHRS